MTHIYVGKLPFIGSDNGLSPGRRQAIKWTNAGILLSGPLETNVSEILIEILIFSFKKIRLKVSSAKWRPFCLGLNVINVAFAIYRYGTTPWFNHPQVLYLVEFPNHMPIVPVWSCLCNYLVPFHITTSTWFTMHIHIHWGIGRDLNEI